MNKILRIVSVLLVAVMLASALSVCTFAAKKEYYANQNALIEAGQDIYSTGENDYSVTNQRKISVDGIIHPKEAWVCVTENYVDKSNASTALFAESNPTVTVKPSGMYEELMPDTKYYVGQSEDKIYIAVETKFPYVESPKNKRFSTLNKWSYYAVRLGFNPDDMNQQVVITHEGNTLANHAKVKGLADATTITEGVGAAILSASQAGATNLDTKKDWTLAIELEIDKAAVKETYKEVFGVDITDDAFNLVFIGATQQSYPNPFENNVLVRPAFGTILTEADAAKLGTSKFVPDVLFFGEMEEETKAPATEAPTDAPATDAPEGNGADEPAQAGGCGGTVSFAGIALVMALGTCTAFVAKKKD